MNALLRKLRVDAVNPGACSGKKMWKSGEQRLRSFSPATGNAIADVMLADAADYDVVAEQAASTFLKWRTTPAPVRGQLVRALGNRLREFCEPLGELVSLEMGKIRAEGIGEVQEMIASVTSRRGCRDNSVGAQCIPNALSIACMNNGIRSGRSVSPAARKLAVRLAEKKRPAAVENPVRMRGRPICGGKRIQSTGLHHCHWRREFNSDE